MGEAVAQAQEPDVSNHTKLKYRKGDHPRLWVGDGRLAKIAERCAPGGCMNAEYVALKNKVDAELASGKTYLWGAKIVAIGLCYLVEKHHDRNVEPYLRGLKSVIGIDNPQLDRGRVWQYATAVDWAWNDLTAPERTAAAKWLIGDAIHQAWRYRRPTEEPRGRNWHRDDSIAVTHTALTNVVLAQLKPWPVTRAGVRPAGDEGFSVSVEPAGGHGRYPRLGARLRQAVPGDRCSQHNGTHDFQLCLAPIPLN